MLLKLPINLVNGVSSTSAEAIISLIFPISVSLPMATTMPVPTP